MKSMTKMILFLIELNMAGQEWINYYLVMFILFTFFISA